MVSDSDWSTTVFISENIDIAHSNNVKLKLSLKFLMSIASYYLVIERLERKVSDSDADQRAIDSISFGGAF